MLLPQILALALIALLVRLFLRPQAQRWAIFLLSAAAIFWLQPAVPVRYLAFWMPVWTLALAVLSWVITTPREQRGGRENLIAGLALAGVTLLVLAAREVSLPDFLALPSPPPLLTALAGLGLAALLAGVLARFLPVSRAACGAGILALITLFVVLKLQPLGTAASAFLRTTAGQSAALASFTDLRWLGFSYVAFRLLHTLRDRQTGRLPVVNLREYLTYAIFFPSFTAGPIDRLERFTRDLCAPERPIPDDLWAGGRRLAVGLFKKFVLADSLALIALNGQNAAQVSAPAWLWVLVYAYTFQIYFDFAGYTDIAIGLGTFLGIQLPENFNRPYLRTSLATFWNSWHMTLTNWFRAYFFNPFTRWLRSGPRSLPVPAVILITQVATMVLIGLWHGITWSFVAWGLWHGLGLFVQNRWTDFIRPRLTGATPRQRSLLTGLSWLLTFNYVALGWVWFALPDPSLSLRVLLRLFGLAGA